MRGPMTRLRNITFWFGSSFLSVGILSMFYGYFYGPAAFFFVFRITMIFAMPVACLYLPVVISVRMPKNGDFGYS
jgi:hypothetical protein